METLWSLGKKLVEVGIKTKKRRAAPTIELGEKARLPMINFSFKMATANRVTGSNHFSRKLFFFDDDVTFSGKPSAQPDRPEPGYMV